MRKGADPYPEPDWNQGKRWSPLGQPHPLTLVKVRWLGQGRSPKGAAQVKPPNGLIKGDLVPGSCVSTHDVCECVCSGVMVLMLQLQCLKGLSVDAGCYCRWCRQHCFIFPAAGWWMVGGLLVLLLLLSQSGDCGCCIGRCCTHPSSMSFKMALIALEVSGRPVWK